MFSFLLIALAQAADLCEESSDILHVGVDWSPPFSYQGPDGWTGISVDLWEAVAKEGGLKFTYVQGDFQDLLADLSSCQLDVVLPAITVTSEREVAFDFSRTYMLEPVVVATGSQRTPAEFTWAIVSELSRPFGILMTFLTVGGLGYLVLEKSRGQRWSTPRENSQHFFDSIYWDMTTMVTVGYGDEAPRSIPGRVYAMGLMLVSLFLFSSVNAHVLQAYEQTTWTPEVTRLSDISDRGREVFTVVGSYAQERCIPPWIC